MKYNIIFNESNLKVLMREINNYLYNDKNYILIENCVSERTICGCIKEYLDYCFIGSGYSVDLEYNRDIEIDSYKVMEGPKEDIPNIECGLIDSKEDIKTLFLKKLVKDNKYNQIEFIKRFFPDIIVHRRGNNNDNLILIEVKKHDDRYAKLDLIKLAMIKKFCRLNYMYYIYFEYNDKTKNVFETKIYYLDNTPDNYSFKKIDVKSI